MGIWDSKDRGSTALHHHNIDFRENKKGCNKKESGRIGRSRRR